MSTFPHPVGVDWEHTNYVTRPSPNIPEFDLLPHVAEVASFPPCSSIIGAPQETKTKDNLFESALAQLPELVDERKKKPQLVISSFRYPPPSLILSLLMNLMTVVLHN